MLRQDQTPPVAFLLVAVVGALAATLVMLGNPGNMGICGACFLRDTAGAMKLFVAGPKIFRPEVLGLVLGALLAVVARRRFTARSGSFAVSRFLLGVWMSIGALVFLGCPFRMLQRLGGGDLNAAVGAAGLVTGVFVALQFERRGYRVGRTSPAPGAVGLAGPVTLLLIGAAWAWGGILAGPGLGDSGSPAHAPWFAALGVALVAGVLLQVTGFCAISGCRALFSSRRTMALALLALVGAYAAITAAGGRFSLGFADQPAAHQEHLWNFLALVLVGLAGAFAGGCPVRQMIMTGEGNGDAMVTVCGLVVGGALSHTLGLASSGKGTTPAGQAAILIGITLVLVYAWSITRSRED